LAQVEAIPSEYLGRAKSMERGEGPKIPSQDSRKMVYVTVICFEGTVESVYVSSTWERAKVIYENETGQPWSDFENASGSLWDVQGDFAGSNIFMVFIDE
jgi:hypothetical protein